MPADSLDDGWNRKRPEYLAVRRAADHAGKKPPATPPKPDLEPKAIELLKAVSERLAAAQTLSFTAVQLVESRAARAHPLPMRQRQKPLYRGLTSCV